MVINVWSDRWKMERKVVWSYLLNNCALEIIDEKTNALVDNLYRLIAMTVHCVKMP